MTAIKARKCFVPRSPSEWVAKVFLTCDNMLAVQFRHGQKVKKILAHGPGAYLGRGGVPSVCCLYPGTQGDLAERLYQLAQVWPYGGEWVHAFLYKKFGYRLVQPPAQCGDCNTTCTIGLNPATPAVGQAVTISCTVTNTDGSATKGDAPKGTVKFSVDGTTIGTATLPDNEPDTQNYETVSVSWTATSGTHTIAAAFTAADTEFANTNCSTTVTVSGGGGVTTTCCPNNTLPDTVYVTISNAAGCTCLEGTYTLTWDAANSEWNAYVNGLCGQASVQFNLYCGNGQWGFACGVLQQTSLSGSCSPFALSGTTTGDGSAVNCTGTVNVSVST
jgi:hypothetical protein